MRYLLSISIGPVQDFIATARRSRDLWFGSWLLSEISKTVAKKIQSDGGELIFPSPINAATELDEDSTYSVVNKLLAKIESNHIHNDCEGIRQALLKRLSDIGKDAFGDLKKLAKINGNEAIHWEIADKQIKDLVEFYWAAFPFDGQNYELARKRVEALLAARKVTRNFKPVDWGDNVPKSSLDGLRESVIDEAVFDRLDERKLSETSKAGILRELRTQYGVRGKERLCAVGLLKRHGKPKKNNRGIDNFFSTSHVAALPLLRRLKDKAAANKYLDALKTLLKIDDHQVQSYLGHVPKHASLKTNDYFCNNDGTLFYDGHLLFKERLSEFFPDDDKRKEAESALAAFLKEAFGTKENPNPYPHPYYAILHADGDRMGAVIDQQAAKGIGSHQKLSQALSEFAADVKEVVEINHEGSCIYSGGDDVLALLPLHTALECARELADKFQSALKDFPDNDDNAPTLSVGLAVGHHLDPLQDTLNLAREAEKTAKKEVPNKRTPEKNALAITLSKRSGVDRTVKGSWDKSKPTRALDSRLNRFIFLHLEDELPDGAAYELQDLALRLKPPKDASPEDRLTLLRAQQAEAKRILRRKQPKRGAAPKPVDTILDEFCGVKGKDGAKGFIDQTDLESWTLASLADELIIAREFARAIDQSGTKDEFAKAHGFALNDKESTNGSE